MAESCFKPPGLLWGMFFLGQGCQTSFYDAWTVGCGETTTTKDPTTTTKDPTTTTKDPTSTKQRPNPVFDQSVGLAETCSDLPGAENLTAT